jgi:hypothetical protein
MSRLIPSNHGADIRAGHTRAGCAALYLRGSVGLPSDELFAIPATRTASAYVESFMTRENRDVASVRAGYNHDIHPTQQSPLVPGATRVKP